MDRTRSNVLRLFDLIRSYGYKPVIVADLTSDMKSVAKYISNDLVSGVMFMGIHPGVLKQTARPELVLKNLSELKELCDLNEIFVQCDGGVTFETIAPLNKQGINNFICGSSTLYKNCDFNLSHEDVCNSIRKNWKLIKDKINE